MNRPILKFIWKYKEPQVAKIVLKKISRFMKGFPLPDFKIYYKDTVLIIKTVYYWQKDRFIE